MRELLKFAASDMLYRGAKPVMWSPVEKTALAEAEIEYEDIVSTQIDVAFEIVESPIAELVGAHAVIWTTTPWTIPVNQALAYGPEVEYVYVDVRWHRPRATGRCQETLRSAEAAIDATARSPERGCGREERGRRASRQRLTSSMPPWPSLAVQTCSVAFGLTRRFRIKGSDLAGTSRPPPDAPPRRLLRRARVPSSRAISSPPTAAPAWSICRPTMARMISTCARRTGSTPCSRSRATANIARTGAGSAVRRSVINPKFNAPDGPICTDLREAGALLAACADYKHSYPHSWRSKAKVIYRCTPQWFVPMDKVMTHIEPKTPREKRWENEGGALNPHEEGISATPRPCGRRRCRRSPTRASSPTRAATASGRWSRGAPTGC